MAVAFKGAFVTLKHKFGRAIVIKKKKIGKREIMCKDWWQQIQEFFFFPGRQNRYIMSVITKGGFRVGLVGFF